MLDIVCTILLWHETTLQTGKQAQLVEKDTFLYS
jgi:hypothetical protein